MKKLILSLILACSAMAAQAMSYERAREEARFLTDKMAYELNLDDQQYNDCYEINLDYFLNLTTEEDIVYGNYLAYRNADLRHILFDWQWNIFAAADYFLNPVSWLRGAWHFPIYRYYRVGYFYYDHPRVFWSYRGGHGRHYFHHGFYASRRPHHWAGGFRGHDRGPIEHRGRGYHVGGNYRDSRAGTGRAGGNYRDSRAGGNYRDSRSGSGRAGSVGTIGHSSYQHESSTRTTVHSNGMSSGRAGGYSIGGTPSHSSSRSAGSFSGGSSRSAGSFSGGSRSAGSFSGGSSRSAGSFSGGSSRSAGSYSGGSSRSVGSFGGGSSRSAGSFSGGSTRSGGSFSGGGSSRGGSSRGGGRGGR